MDDLILYGGEVKTRGNDIVEGHLVMFSTEKDPDISRERDFFTPETDYDLEFTAKSRVLYRHGFDKDLGMKRLAVGEMKMDEVGVWIEAQMLMRDDYEKAVFSLAKSGKLGWSSGTAPHLVEREKVGDANKVLRWPLGLDASLTPDPAEPRTMVSVKSLMDASVKRFDPEHDWTAREFEDFLRDAGVPKDLAPSIALHGWKAVALRRDAEGRAESDALTRGALETLLLGLRIRAATHGV